MKITDVKRIDEIDLSGQIIYSAVIDGDKIIICEDGFIRKHMTKAEFKKMVKNNKNKD